MSAKGFEAVAHVAMWQAWTWFQEISGWLSGKKLSSGITILRVQAQAPKLKWSLKIPPWKRRNIDPNPAISTFHVSSFPGCNSFEC